MKCTRVHSYIRTFVQNKKAELVRFCLLFLGGIAREAQSNFLLWWDWIGWRSGEVAGFLRCSDSWSRMPRCECRWRSIRWVCHQWWWCLVADAYGESIVTFRVSTDLAEFSASLHCAIPTDNVVVADTLLVFSVASRPLSFRHCKVTTIYTFLQYFQIHRPKNSYLVANRLQKGRRNR